MIRSLLFILLLASFCRADPNWLLTTADFKTQPVTVMGIDAQSIQYTPPAGGDPSTLPFPQFLQLQRSSSFGASASSAKFALYLLNGDKLLGQPTAIENEQLVWKSPALGELKISLKRCRALSRSSKTPERLDQARTEDFVQMSNGDNAKGIITEISDAKLKINSNNADIELPLEAVDWAQFATPVQPAAAAGLAFRITLADGSILTAPSLTADAKELKLALGGGDTRSIPLASLSGIEQLNGPVSWLSSRTPAQVVQIPYFGALAWPTHFDQTVSSKPITFNGRTFSRGIGVHAYSRIDYALDGQWPAFRTQYAIAQDDKRQYADVTVRIKLDGKIVHEKANVKADVLSPVVVIDIPQAAKMLTLEVDYGAANDVQDRFNWIEPALLKSKPPEPPPPPPQTQPATQPADSKK